MDSFSFQLLRVLIFIASTYGVGSTVNSYLNKEDDGYAFSFCLGLATWLAIGGPLTAFSLAGQNTLILLQLVGLGLCIRTLTIKINKSKTLNPALGKQSNLEQALQITQLSTSHTPSLTPSQIVNWVFVALVFSLLCFLTYYLMPTYVFNYHDDFHVYIPPIVQIIETGTFSIDSLNNTIAHTFGGQPFLQALSLIKYKTQDVNLFDAIICYCAVIVLLYEYGIKYAIDKRIIALAIILFVFINHQYVSVTALFSTSLLALALLLSCLKLSAHYIENAEKQGKLNIKLHLLVAL